MTVFDGLARRMGAALDRQGIRIVEFAHIGIGPLIKIADALGVPWYAVCDGDTQGVADASKVGEAC